MLKQKLLDLNLINTNDSTCLEALDLYINLVSNPDKDGVTLHHIIPVSFYKELNLDIDNSSSNLVKLNYKNHILAHYLIYKMLKQGVLKKKHAYVVYSMLNESTSCKWSKLSLEEFNELMSSIDLQRLYSDRIEFMKGANNPSKNKDVIAKIKTSRSGYKHTDETKKKISKSRTGKHYKKLSDSKKGCVSSFKGHNHTKESKQKISEASKVTSKGRKWYCDDSGNYVYAKICPEGYHKSCRPTRIKNWNAKRVKCISTGVIYKSLSAASKASGINSKVITNACNSIDNLPHIDISHSRLRNITQAEYEELLKLKWCWVQATEVENEG